MSIFHIYINYGLSFAVLFLLLKVLGFIKIKALSLNLIHEVFIMTFSLQKSVLSAVGGLALLFNTGAALSASSASAWIDWNTFTITALDLGSGLPSYSLSDEYTNVSANEPSNWQYDYAYDWTSSISASLAGANAKADGSQLLASAQTSYGWSNAYAYRSATLQVNGSGLLLFRAVYVLNAAIDGHPGDYADASVSFGADIDSQNGWESTSTYSSLYLDGWWGSADQASKSKTLALALLVNDGDRINFHAQSSANVNAVPVPAAVWLLGTALVGLISVGRRRTAV